MEQDNSSTLAALVCKARSLGRWRLAVQEARLRGQLSRAEKVSVGGRPLPAMLLPEDWAQLPRWWQVAGGPAMLKDLAVGN